ncbi:orotidine-5'-phosphate decarboxylase [Vibrio sp. qd031]|uniref:orotidine-5'-phosphate decarboxylase n=1 Tax=Vibrio sp. qd031 TaxID=1603038 RepID=UPI001555BAA0|nr:orotidine-5'-phosphate decarboxylase [Vibrio sp. qd031]
MNFEKKLSARIETLGAFLCIGLDPDDAILDKYGYSDDVFGFNKQLIDATHQFATAYKPQFAHYAATGKEEQLARTIAYINSTYPDIPVILDSKRGDIGSTAQKYAQESFERYKVDAVTLNPYMGIETLKPYYEYTTKACITLIKTSNPGSNDFQELVVGDNRKLYQVIAEKVTSLYPQEQTCFVVGATNPDEIETLRRTHPNVTFLVPGLGVQGGDLESVIKGGMTADGKGLILNVSRGITQLSEIADFEVYLKSVSLKAREWYSDIKGCRQRELENRSKLYSK